MVGLVGRKIAMWASSALASSLPAGARRLWSPAAPCGRWVRSVSSGGWAASWVQRSSEVWGLSRWWSRRSCGFPHTSCLASWWTRWWGSCEFYLSAPVTRVVFFRDALLLSYPLLYKYVFFQTPLWKRVFGGEGGGEPKFFWKKKNWFAEKFQTPIFFFFWNWSFFKYLKHVFSENSSRQRRQQKSLFYATLLLNLLQLPIEGIQNFMNLVAARNFKCLKDVFIFLRKSVKNFRYNLQ